jgi:polyhydroxyalkanoate synthase
MELAAKMMANPYRMAEAQMNLWWEYMSLWQASTAKLLGGAPDPVAEPTKGDKRFRHEDWEEHFLFDYIKQSYLITARWLHDAVGNCRGPRRRDEEERSTSSRASTSTRSRRRISR